MCAGTALLIVTLSDGCLQMLLAVTVHVTSTPGTTFSGVTIVTLLTPFASTTSLAISAVDLSRMQPCVPCANDCEAKPQAINAAAVRNFTFPLIMCVSFTCAFPD